MEQNDFTTVVTSYGLLGCGIVLCGRWVPAFFMNLMPRYSTLKMEAQEFSETLKSIYRTTQRHMSDDLT